MRHYWSCCTSRRSWRATSSVTSPTAIALVDREHPEQTRLFVYISAGDMDAIIEAQERISAKSSPRDRFEPLHVSVVFQG
jgi:hypothetical protein